MDTIETNDEPAGSDGATSSPDTSSEVDTQPEVSEAPVSDGTTEETTGDSEALLAGKYKSPADLEKAYKELEGKLGELGQRASVADLIQEKYGMDPDTLRQTIEAQEAERQQQMYQQNPGAFAVQKVQELEAKLALRDEERELDSFLQKNPEYSAQRDKLLKLGLNLEKDKTYEEIARDYFGSTRAQGQQDAYKKIETKKMTQTTGTVSAPSRKVDLLNEDLTVEEMEKILPWADTSHRPY